MPSNIKKDGTIYCRCMEKERDGDTIWFEFINQDTGIGMDVGYGRIGSYLMRY